jgi:regulator of protease activity HflC (stomatin/prohibitin superfamily)
LIALLGPGRYWIREKVEQIVVMDTRRRHLIIAGQEVLTSDRVPLKVSVVAEYSISDVTKALTVVDKYQEILYARVQLALRQAVSERDLDAALAERGELGTALVEMVRESALEFGATLHKVEIRDFMMGGGLRNAYAEIVQAKQQGLAALERARGESAAIRNLANSAQLMEQHPGLMQLRLLQAVESGSGNRIVIALDPARGKFKEVEIAAEDDP